MTYQSAFWKLALILLVIGTVLAACQGVEGPEGPGGPPGPPGPRGPAGPAVIGDGSESPGYAGSSQCQGCHNDIYTTYRQSGHPYKLNAVVDGQPPDYPFSEVPDPPDGYTWNDIAYVIGGYGWKARFIDLNGYIITGGSGATTQYNLANETLKKDANWVAYHAGEENVPYDCGSCHTTGYSSFPPGLHEDDREGIVGTWAEAGVTCEACHGPASLHVADPGNLNVRPTVTRDSELCGECHMGGSAENIEVEGNFIQHHEQYEEFHQSKHLALDCVDCHNPHATTVYRNEPEVEVSGIRIQCADCHWEQAQFMAADHPQLPQLKECIVCHMAGVARSAQANDSMLRGDISSHLFSINPYATEQFETVDGVTYSQSYITVLYACRYCHSEEGLATPKEDDVLIGFAQGWHDRDRAAGGE